MSGSTAQNGGLTIPTLATPHAGVTITPTDVCKLPNNTPAPFDNQAMTSSGQSTTSAKTVIKGKQIITIQTKFGAPSFPVHAGTNGGIKSGTYREYAMVTKASTDLRTEGQPPARHTDPTAQNAFNTQGILIDTTLPRDDQIAAMRLLARCQVIEIEVSDGPRKMKDGLLEVLIGSEIKIVATRKNATAARGSKAWNTPVCEPPPGGFDKTRFHLIRSGGNAAPMSGGAWGLPWKQDTKDGVDELTLGKDWVGEPPAADNQTLQAAEQGPGNLKIGTSNDKPAGIDDPSLNTRRVGGFDQVAAERAYAASVDARRRQIAPTIEGPPPRNAQEAARREQVLDAFRQENERQLAEIRSQVYNQQREKLEAAKSRFEAGAKKERAIFRSAEMAFRIWQLTPTQIQLTAQGCTGVQAGTIRLYPHGQKEFDFLDLFKNAFGWVERLLKKFDDLCKTLNKGGAGRQYKLELFKDPQLKLQVEWKELTRATKDGSLQPHHCYIDWTVLVGFSKLVAFTADYAVSVLTIAGGALGKIAAAILNRMGVAIDLGVKAEFAIGLNFLAGRDEYKEAKPAQLTAPIVAQFSLYIVFRGGTLGSATASVNLKYETAIADHRITDANRQTKVELYFDKSTISLYWEASIQADVPGLRDRKTFNGNLIDPIVYPAAWKTVWPLGG